MTTQQQQQQQQKQQPTSSVVCSSEGRPAGYDATGAAREPLLITVCGPTSSGKSALASAITGLLNMPWVATVRLDSFLRPIPAALLAAMCLCVCLGSVNIPLRETLAVLGTALRRGAAPEGVSVPIILRVRVPRVLCVALSGAGLSLAGACMQGLLRNPLADGSTLGVSSGAALGAVIAIAFGLNFPSLPFAGTTVMAVLFAFGSLALILALAYRLDYSLSPNTIILIGVIYSMFVSSAMSILVTFASDKLKSITFWTMGSFQGSTYGNAALLAAARQRGLPVIGGLALLHAQAELAFELFIK